MGGQLEGICPICMEEMDLTDHELQPCICGYKICLWCWHLIIQTATREGSDARCPACHSSYDKEKILKRTISKERLEMVNANKKHKLQKRKQRLTDAGNDLNSIRVIRRNIAYIAGIPKNLSNEKTLRRKEYLGQYGKIVKILFAQTDLSRQYYSSDSCIVYATFSMEEEAIRCIQVVNGYILDGRPLKASFGTARYCYSWLNNLPCKNPDCLYVHDVVPQEDICSREEVIPFCTSKLQQCPELAFTNLKQHSGSFLPPPLETKSSLPPLGLISNNRHMQSDCFGRSYATVAASHNESKLFSMNDNLVMPSSRAEVFFPSNTGDHNHVSTGFFTSRNKMSLPKHDMENLSHEKPFVGICHSKNTCSPPDYKTALETILVVEDNTCRPYYLDDHLSKRIIRESFLSHSDGNSQLSTSPANVMMHTSASSLNSLTTGKWKCESMGSIAKKNSSEWDDLGAVSRKFDPFLRLQTLPGDSTSIQQNAVPSCDWSGFHSDLGSAKFICSFEDKSLSAPVKRTSQDFSTFSTIATNLYHKLDKPSAVFSTEPMLFHGEQNNLCSRSSSSSGPGFEFPPTNKIRDEKFLNESCSDLESVKFNCSSEDESFSAPFSKKSKDFSTFSTIATNLYHKLDKSSAILPAEPMLFHEKQKNLCSRSSSNSGPDFEFSHTDKTRDDKFLNESYIEQCEDRILSDILALDIDTIDNPGDTHSVLEQLGSSDDLSRKSNSSSPSTNDGSKSYFSMMEDLYAAIGQLSPWSNGTSGLTKSSCRSESTAKKEAYMEDSLNKSYLETLKTSKVLNRTSFLSATEVVSDSGSSLDMHHSGSPSSLAISQHPYANSTRKITLSTPPGFPPRKTNPGSSTTQSQLDKSFSARCFSNTKATSSSDTDSARIISSAKEILPSSIASLDTFEYPNLATFNGHDKQNLWKSLTTSDATNRNNSSQHLFFQHISNFQESWTEFNSVSSNAIDFGGIGRNQPSLSTISSVVPELQNRQLASYF